MSEFGPIYDGLEEALSKVWLLKDSCECIHQNEQSPGEVWFDGVRIILGEVITCLNEGIDYMEGLIRRERERNGMAKGQ
jgi:hypothetical protein